MTGFDEAEFEVEFPGDLQEYLASQIGTRDMRSADAVSYPYPSNDHPMVRYVSHKAIKMAMSPKSTVEQAIVWATVHAWFEATIAERARVAKRLCRMLDHE